MSGWYFYTFAKRLDTALTIHTQQSINIKLRTRLAFQIKGFIQKQLYRLNERLKALRIILLILRFNIVVSWELADTNFISRDMKTEQMICAVMLSCSTV